MRRLQPAIHELVMILAEIAVQDFLAEIEAGDDRDRPAASIQKNQAGHAPDCAVFIAGGESRDPDSSAAHEQFNQNPSEVKK